MKNLQFVTLLPSCPFSVIWRIRRQHGKEYVSPLTEQFTRTYTLSLLALCTAQDCGTVCEKSGVWNIFSYCSFSPSFFASIFPSFVVSLLYYTKTSFSSGPLRKYR